MIERGQCVTSGLASARPRALGLRRADALGCFSAPAPANPVLVRLPGRDRPYVHGPRWLARLLSRLRRQQAGRWLAVEVRMHRLLQVAPRRPPLLGARRQHAPDPLAPALPRRAARPLRDVPVDHHEANRLLGQVVGRFDLRRRDEAEVALLSYFP
jgi:hypothetical protein